MNLNFMVRCTPDDKLALKLEAQKRGMDVSQLIRTILIQEKILNPVGVENRSDNNW